MRTRKQTGPKSKPKAATAEVLGAARRPQPVPARWRSHYQHLLELRQHLMEEQTALAQSALEEQPGFSTHMADAATDTFDRDLALGLLSSEQDALYQVDQALERIHEGTYGRCELTGQAIDGARLEALPWSRFSLGAERQLEREGAFKRARLGPRTSVARSKLARPR